MLLCEDGENRVKALEKSGRKREGKEAEVEMLQTFCVRDVKVQMVISFSWVT